MKAWVLSILLQCYFHSHKKRKDSQEGSLVRVLFAAELKFPKIPVSRLLQNTSNVNIENTGKSKKNLCDQLLGALTYLHFIVLIFLCFQLVMSGVNYTINGCTINTYKYKEIPIKTPIKSHPLLRLEKLQIIPNINNLMFQVIFIFSD